MRLAGEGESYPGKDGPSFLGAQRGSVCYSVGGIVTSVLSALRQKYKVALLCLILSWSPESLGWIFSERAAHQRLTRSSCKNQTSL